MNSFCRGCNTQICSLKMKAHYANCPCVNCVIKSMCSEPCKDMLKYYRKNILINPTNPQPLRETKFRRKKK